MPALTFSDRQVEALVGSTRRLNIWEGSVRSGKTYTSIIRWCEYVLTAPPGNLLMAGKTERTLKRNIIDPMKDLLGDRNVRLARGSGELHVGGRMVYTAGANDERAQDKIRGLTLAGAYGDELTVWPESFFKMLLSRLSVPGAKFFGTTNPDIPQHWLLRDYLASDDPDMDLARFYFHLSDNPSLDPAYIRSLKAEYGPPGSVWYRRFIDGAWVLAEGLVWPWDRDRNLSGPLRCRDYWLAVDYGTVNPLVALLIGVGEGDDGRDRLHVAAEWRWDSRRERRQLTDAEYSASIADWLAGGCDGVTDGPIRPSRTFVDPSAASFMTQLWRDGWTGVVAADNAVADGLRTVGSLMARGRITVDRSCLDTGLVDEVEGYAWDEKARERGEEKPLKQDDHGPDALRYGVMGLRHVWRHWTAEPAPE